MSIGTAATEKTRNKSRTLTLARLNSLQPIPRVDPADVARYFPRSARNHTGRMRSSLVHELVQRYASGRIHDLVLADPLAGTGLVGVVGALEGVGEFLGCEIIRRWHRVASTALDRVAADAGGRFHHRFRLDDAGEVHLAQHRIGLLITSPVFPNAHTQGKSKMQAALRASKSTYAGNDFECGRKWGCGSNPRRGLWIGQLTRTLRPWVERCARGAPILIHVKNFSREGVEVRVDEWAVEALLELGGVQVVGYHAVPLAYRSGFREWGRFPRQRAISRRSNKGGTGWIETLECGHEKVRKPMDPAALPKSACCVQCGPKDDHVEVCEERVVVARRV